MCPLWRGEQRSAWTHKDGMFYWLICVSFIYGAYWRCSSVFCAVIGQVKEIVQDLGNEHSLQELDEKTHTLLCVVNLKLYSQEINRSRQEVACHNMPVKQQIIIFTLYFLCQLNKQNVFCFQSRCFPLFPFSLSIHIFIKFFFFVLG